MNCEKEEGIEGEFRQNNYALVIIIFAVVSAVLFVLCTITFNGVLVVAGFLVLLIGAAILPNDTKSSYKADNETIIFMIGHFKKCAYPITTSEINLINTDK